MARTRSVLAAALNIKGLNFEDEAPYPNLMQKAFDLHRTFKLFGDRFGSIASFGLVHGGRLDGKHLGNLVTYVDVSLGDKWINKVRLQEATDEELSQISIPADLAAKYRVVPFIFDAATHTLVFEINHRGPLITPIQMHEFFEQLMNEPAIIEEFGTIEVVVIKSAKILETILALPTLKRIRIEITPPNPIRRRAEAIRDNLRNMSVDSAVLEYKNRKGATIKPDEQTRAWMEAAEDDGHVDVDGIDGEGKRVHYSTEKKPEIKTRKYDADSDHIEALVSTMREFVARRRNG